MGGHKEGVEFEWLCGLSNMAAINFYFRYLSMQWQHSEKNSRRRLLNDEQLRALLAGKSPRRTRRTSSSSTLGDIAATATNTCGQDTVMMCGNSSAAIGSAQISLMDGGLSTPGTLDTPASELKNGPLSIVDPPHQP